MSEARTSIAASIARLVGFLGRRFGRSGTSLPGRVLLALSPGSIADLSGRLAGGSVVVSGTNGKTTTSTLIASALGSGGLDPVHNSAGANMPGGIASVLIADSRLDGPNRIGLFEVDEFWLPELLPQLRPRIVVLSNLFRDQLDRYGELDTILDRWRAAVQVGVEQGVRFVVCADDPGLASLADGLPRTAFSWFGIEDVGVALGSLPHAADSGRCRRCGSILGYDAVILGHLGHWRCPGCGASRPEPDVRLDRIELDGARGSRIRISTPEGTFTADIGLPGVYNAYNALAAWSACREADLAPEAIRQGIETSGAAFGRAESFRIGGRTATLMLIKNPVGANEVVRTLAAEPGEIDVVFVLNDGIADGRDVSWIWDADFEDLSERVGRVVCSGSRSSEMALRLVYGGFPADRIEVEQDPELALTLHGDRSDRRLWILPTYTALLGLRTSLTRRGLLEPIR